MIPPEGPRGKRLLLARWSDKFREAGDGLLYGLQTQESLRVHVAFALAVVAVAAGLQVEAWRWAILVLCIAVVVASELFNSAVEQLVRTLHPERDPAIAAVLHMAAAGVLVNAIGAVVIGLIVLGPPLLEWISAKL